MTYETKSETEDLQNVPKVLESLGAVPPIAWVTGVLLLMKMAGTLNFIGAGLLWIGAFLFLRHLSHAAALSEAKAKAAAWANVCGPVIVASIHPGEGLAEVNTRAEFWKEQLALSGNPYASILPVVILPYQPLLVDIGHLPAAWSEYQRRVSETQHFENIKWYEGKCPAHLKQIFAAAVLPQPKIDN